MGESVMEFNYKNLQTYRVYVNQSPYGICMMAHKCVVKAHAIVFYVVSSEFGIDWPIATFDVLTVETVVLTTGPLMSRTETIFENTVRAA